MTPPGRHRRTSTPARGGYPQASPDSVGGQWQTTEMPTAESLLADLDDDQRRAAQALHGPVVIIAGAGSGKTSVITRRIAFGVHTGEHDPRRSVAVTFTTKAAGEMTRRLRSLGVDGVRVRTFHAAALRQLRYYWPRYIGGQVPELLPAKAGVVATSAGAIGLANDKAAIRDAAAEIEWAKTQGLHPDAYAAAVVARGRPPVGAFSTPEMVRLFTEYERRKDAAGRIDFEDVLLLMVALLEGEPRVRAHLQPALAHLTVDEYQDASPLQQRLLDGWLGDNDNICVVGDPMQTIYTFAGADATLLERFPSRYDDATVVQLTRTYRCSPEVVTAANGVLTAAGAPLRLRSARESGPAVRVTSYSDETAESEGVARRVTELIAEGVPPGRMAVLVRMNAMTERFEAAFAEASIPYRIAGGTGYFRRPEVRQAISVIRGAAVAGDDAADVGDAVEMLLTGLGWSVAPPAGAGAVREKWESLAGLAAAAREYAASNPQGGLAGFGAELLDRAEHQDAPDADGVTLTSLHAAKGLEWEAVFLVGLLEGVLPHGSAETKADIDEERRLFYVGITRAARHLDISYASAKSPRGRARTPSRFLDALPQSDPRRLGVGVIAAADGKARSGSRGRSRKRSAVCDTCGETLETPAELKWSHCRQCPSQIDIALLDELLLWRTSVVDELAAERDSRPPAFIVATDATLAAIAAQRPTTLDDLAEVPGIGPAKVTAYGESIIATVKGAAG